MALGAAWLVGFWWCARTLAIPAGDHAHSIASAVAAFAAGAAVMGMPCVLQMSAVCLALLTGAPLDGLDEGARRAGRARLLGSLALFGSGYLALLVAALAALGPAVWALGPAAPALRPFLEMAGIATLGLLGLGLLGAFPVPGRPCAGAFGFLRRAAGASPPALGAAFALYCAACCGPMLLPLGILGAASPGRAAILAAAFGAGAGLPFLLAVASVGWAARVARGLAAHALGWRRACGAALLAMGFLGVMGPP